MGKDKQTGRGEVNQLKVKVSVKGQKNRPPFKPQVNLREVIQWIKSRNYEPLTEEALIKKVSNYPHGCYWQFAKHINTFVQEINESKEND